MDLRKTFHRLKNIFRRLNQLVLVFPVWLVVGVSGVLRGFEQRGWTKSSENTDYEKMY